MAAALSDSVPESHSEPWRPVPPFRRQVSLANNLRTERENVSTTATSALLRVAFMGIIVLHLIPVQGAQIGTVE